MTERETIQKVKEIILFNPFATPQDILDHFLRNQEFTSARFIHKLLGIRQPYGLWLSRHLTHLEVLTDYLRVGNDTFLSPTLATVIATSGGSELGAKVQVLFIKNLTRAVGNRCPIEMMDTAIKVGQANRFLARELDPEK